MGGALSRRVWLLVGFASLLVVVLLYLNSRKPVARVAVVQVDRENLSAVITSNGKVEPITPYSLRAKFDGFVDKVMVVEGQSVKAGQLLLTLDDRDVRAQLDQARAQLTSQEDDLRAAQAGGRSDQAAKVAGDLKDAEAQRDLLQKQQESLTKLVSQNAATPAELDKNRAALDRANIDVDQLHKAKQEFEHQVELDRERLGLLVQHSRAVVNDLQDKVSSAQVVAPVSGTPYSLPIHPRDFVHTGDLLVEVADLRQVRVRAYIDEPELGQLQPKQAVLVTWNALPDRTWTGYTETVPRQVVARGSRNVGEVLCPIANENMELIPNTTVDVRIRVSERANVLAVPRGAVHIEGSHRYVYRVDDDSLHRVEIQVGLANATKFEVLSGLQQGDTLALEGDTQLKDGMAMRVVSPQ